MNSLLHILCQRGSGIHVTIDLLVQKAVFVSAHKASRGTIFGDQPSSFAGHVAYLIRRGSKFSTNAYVNNAPKRSNASMISARFHIRSDRAIFNTGGFSGSSFTEAIDRAFIANAIAKVPRMRIGLPKNFKAGASYCKADIVTK